MTSRNTILFGAAFAALLLWNKRANAYVPDEESLAENDVGFVPDESTAATFTDETFWEDDPYSTWAPSGDMDMSDPSKNLAAFLYLIRSSEHIWPMNVVDTDAAYFTYFGGSTFSNTADHPVLTGEKVGVPLPDHVCKNAGFGPGCVSTAAGAYQINKPTWNAVRARAPRLRDFSPASQDEAARRILDEIGALPLIEAGQFDAAIKIAGRRWASLPGARGGQRQRSQQFAMARIGEILNQG